MAFEVECVLGDVAELVRGVAYKPDALVDVMQPDAVPLLRATNIRTRALDLQDVLHVPSKLVKDAQYLRKYDVVIAMSSGSRAAVGRLAQLRTSWSGTFGAFCGALRPKRDKVEPEFLAYMLYAPEFRVRIETYATGTAIMNLSRERLLGHPIRLPSRAEQIEIAQLLGQLDDRIELLRETNATLESLASTLFRSWFVDFDLVRCKAQGREPEGIDSGTAALFPAEFAESPLGLIPRDWRASTLEKLCADAGGMIQTGPFGSQLHASDYADEGFPVVMPQDLDGRRISTERIARVGAVHVERLARHKLLKGDIVFSRRGDVGRHAAVTELEAGWLCGTGCLLVRPGPNWPSPAFLSQALATSEAKNWLERHAVGATMPNLNTGILGSLPLILPSRSVLHAFERIVQPIETRISANRAHAAVLGTVRDALLPRLISGKLRAPEAAIEAEEAIA